MTREDRRWAVCTSVVAAAAAAACFARFRRWHLRWGATQGEVGAEMPGDEVVRHPTFAPTRAITIEASPEQVWPWLVQIGYGRAGFYSYDFLDNLGHGRSAERIVPELQELRVGDWIPMAPTITEETAFRVHSMEPGHWMVWSKPQSTWVWQLHALPDGGTRLITRVRMRYRWGRPSVVADLILMELGDPLMMRRELLGIRRRAEASAREGGGNHEHGIDGPVGADREGGGSVHRASRVR
jgi:hypothetical protein